MKMMMIDDDSERTSTCVPAGRPVRWYTVAQTRARAEQAALYAMQELGGRMLALARAFVVPLEPAGTTWILAQWQAMSSIGTGLQDERGVDVREALETFDGVLLTGPGLPETPKFCARRAPVIQGRLIRMRTVEVARENWVARLGEGVEYLAAVRECGRWMYHGGDNAPRFCDADDLAILGQALVMSGQVTEMVWDERWQLIGMWEEGNGKCEGFL